MQPKSTGKGQNTRTSIVKVLVNRNFTKLQQAEDKNTSKCEVELKTSGSGILIKEREQINMLRFPEKEGRHDVALYQRHSRC